MKISIFDTTLRDGSQGESISFSLEDKLLIAQMLDELGIDYIEGGWPSSNPKDKEFFVRARQLKLRHARLTAFGSTRLPKNSVQTDRSVLGLIETGTPTVSIFGKSWDLHTKRALGVTEEQNLQLIAETVAFLKQHGKELIYDAEHFFDGYNANADFALRTLEAARKAGADVLCLCDTNGGTLPGRVAEVVAEVRRRFDGVLGIHTHNDCDVAVANALAAVEQGATHVQGCINGYGERCGNANLCSIIANLELKMGHTVIGPEKLAHLTSLARAIADIANLTPRGEQPFVGKSAFAHKGGVHVSAILKDSTTYEHIRPEAVGNNQRVLVSDLSGQSNILYMLKQHGLEDQLDEKKRRELLERIKHMEFLGYELESAEGTFELLVYEALHPETQFFDVRHYEVVTRMSEDGKSSSTAGVTIAEGNQAHTASAIGHGPVHALDLCLRKCVSSLYPHLTQASLTDYKVRVLDSRSNTAAKVRVLIQWAHDGGKSWSTVGVSDNIIEASWNALVDGARLDLIRLSQQKAASEIAIGK
jgi:2-isopropylmalate synthase